MPRQLLFLPGPVTVAQPVLEAAARPMINHRGPEFAATARAHYRGACARSSERARTSCCSAAREPADSRPALANLFSPGERLLSCPVGAFGKRFAAIAAALRLRRRDARNAARTRARPACAGGAARGRHRATRSPASCSRTTRPRPASPATWRRSRPMLRAHGATHAGRFGQRSRRRRSSAWTNGATTWSSTASQKGFRRAARRRDGRVERTRVAAHGRSASSRAFLLRSASGRDEFARNGQTPWTPPISMLFALDVALAALSRRRHGRRCSRATRAMPTIVRARFERLGFTLFSHAGRALAERSSRPIRRPASTPSAAASACAKARRRAVRRSRRSSRERSFASARWATSARSDVARRDRRDRDRRCERLQVVSPEVRHHERPREPRNRRENRVVDAARRSVTR